MNNNVNYTIASAWHEHMLEDLSADIICSEKRTASFTTLHTAVEPAVHTAVKT